MGLSSQQARNSYPELVVGGVTSTWVVTGTRPKCDWRSTIGVSFDATAEFGGSVNLRVHPSAAEATQALSAVMRAWGYLFRESAGGSVNCRKITGGTKTTLHAHGIAIDFNPSKNRFIRTVARALIQWRRQTDMPRGMVRAIEAIRTNSGHAIWQWGGRWFNIKDAMHYQPTKCTRTRLETGVDWSTVAGDPGEMEDELITRSTRGTLAMDFQRALNSMGLTDAGGNPLGVDGQPGNKTFQAWGKGLAAAGLPHQIKPNEYANDPLMAAVASAMAVGGGTVELETTKIAVVKDVRIR